MNSAARFGLAKRSAVVLACAFTASACSKSTSYTFPKGFLWGVSTAAEQSEGGNTTNDWYALEKLGKAPPVGYADNMWNLYDQDAANARSMSANAFRMTLEWARFMPTPPADPAHPQPSDLDATVVAHYQAVFASLAAHGLTPVVTLTHYTLPIWIDNPAATYDSSTGAFSDGSLGGWTNSATGTDFAAYAGLMAQTYGSSVKYWLTENEPMVDLVSGYMFQLYPPAYLNLSLTENSLPNGASVIDVLRNMIAGHAAAYHAIKAAEPDAKVSIAQNCLAMVPVDSSPAAATATANMKQFYNQTFLDSATMGTYDTSLIGAGPVEQHPEWAQTLDFIGLNYYNHDYVVPVAGLLSPVNAFPCDPVLAGFVGGLLSSLNCPATSLPEPPGMTQILMELTDRYHLPILITENGGSGASAEKKAQYIVQNVMAVHDAIAQGAQLIGYSYWTLNHDYEWMSGYGDSFGLFEIAGMTAGPNGGLPQGVDGGQWSPGPDTDFTRIPLHPAVDVYASIADAGAIPAGLVSQYGADGGT